MSAEAIRELSEQVAKIAELGAVTATDVHTLAVLVAKHQKRIEAFERSLDASQIISRKEPTP